MLRQWQLGSKKKKDKAPFSMKVILRYYLSAGEHVQGNSSCGIWEAGTCSLHPTTSVQVLNSQDCGLLEVIIIKMLM